MGKGIVKLGEGNWAVKDGNLLAAKETNGRFKNAEFTVTRGTRATYVGRDGLIKESNLQNTNLVPSIITTENNNGGVINYISSNIYSSTSDGTSTSIIRPKFDFNTTSGKTYKLVITPTGAITGTVNFDFHDGSSYLFQDYDFTTTKEIYFTDNGNVFGSFDGQQTYSIDSFTISVQEIKTDTPRIDFTDNTDGHLLLEPESTNLIDYSEDFSQWNENDATVTPNSTTSPSGLINADKVIASAINSTHHIGIVPSVSSSTTYTFSLYAKADEYERLYIRQGTGSSPSAAVYELSGTGSVLQTYGSPLNEDIDNVGNGWYRITLTNTTSASGANFAPNIIGIPNSGYSADEDGVTFLGDGASGVYIWGAQLEEQSYSTSYIPTNGGQVTRDAETCTGAGEAADFNSEEGVLYAEIAALADDETNRQMTLSDGSDNNRIVLKYDNQSNVIQVFNRVGGVETAFLSDSVTDIKLFSKCALKYKVNDYALWIDGIEVATDTSSTTFLSSTLNDFKFGDSSGSSNFYGKCKAIRVYKEALSDTDLENLTS